MDPSWHSEHVLLPTLTPTALDDPAVIRVGDDKLSREDLVGAATAVAERIAGARTVAVLATPTVETVLAVVGALIPRGAGRPRSARLRAARVRAHPRGLGGTGVAGAGPRRTHHSCHPGPPLREIVAPSPGTARRFDRTDPLYLRHDRPPQRCSDHQAEHRRGPRRTRRCVVVDRRRHSGAWPSAVPCPRADPRRSRPTAPPSWRR